MSQAPCIRSDACPRAGWITDELTVSARRSAVAPAYDSPRSEIRYGSSAGTAPWHRSLDRWPPAIAVRARLSARTAAGSAWASVAMAATVPNGVGLTAPPLTGRPHCDATRIARACPA